MGASGRYRGAAVVGDEGLGVGPVERPGHQEALALVTAEVDETVELALVLDALGDDLQPEAPGQADDGGDQRRAARVRVDQRIDERLVDLEHVDGEALQMAERGVAGPEVVDGDPDAQLPELGEGLATPVRGLPSARSR